MAQRILTKSTRETPCKKTKGGLTPRVGDVVIIGDNETKRAEWSLGVVE